MKNKFLSFLISIIFLYSCSNYEKKSDLQNHDLYNNVKSVFTLTYTAIDKFGEGDIVKGNLESAYYQEFDSLGYLTFERSYLVYGVEHKSRYEYNSKGEKILWIYNEDGKEKYKDSYEYDSLGNQIIEIDHRDNSISRTSYEYDSNNKIITKRQKYDIYKYYYDDLGNLVKEIDISKLGLSNHTDLYEYDKDKNLIKNVSFYTPTDKKYDRCYLYKYDEKGRLTDFVVFNSIEPNESTISLKKRHFYIDNTAVVPLHTVEWDEKGEIKSDEYYYYQLIDDKPVTTITCNKDFQITSLSFNSNKKNELGYFSDNYLIQSDIWSSGEYKYLNGQLKSIIHEDGNTTQFKYNGKRKIESTKTYGDSRKVTLYDKKERPLIITDYDSKNKITQTIEIKYSGNSKDRIVLSKSLNTKSKEEETVKEVYKDGRLAEIHNTVGGTTEDIIFKYDSKGLLLSMNNLSKGEEITYEYVIDALGNWNKRISFLNGKPESIDERIIQYFL